MERERRIRQELLEFDEKYDKDLTHFYYWQLTLPFDYAHPILRDTTSETAKAIIDSLPDKPKHRYVKRILPGKRLKQYYTGDDYDRDVAVLCYRYETLNLVARVSMQISASDAIYEQRKRDGYTVECFASPFNFHLRHYFSAFPDTDCKFGSIGSFFDHGYHFLSVRAYKCAVDPPYQNEAIQKAIELILKLKHGTYDFILPAWTDAEWVKLLPHPKVITINIYNSSYNPCDSIIDKIEY